MFSINLHKNIFLFPLKKLDACFAYYPKGDFPFFFFFISFQSCALLPFIFLNTLFSDL